MRFSSCDVSTLVGYKKLFTRSDSPVCDDLKYRLWLSTKIPAFEKRSNKENEKINESE